MPKLTTKENGLLQALGSAMVMGSARLKEVSAFMHRLMFLADEADKAKRVAELRYSFIAGAVHGLLSKEDILAKGLPEQLEEEALALRQQYDDAQAWRAEYGETVERQRIHGPITKEEAEMNALFVDMMSFAPPTDGKFLNEEFSVNADETDC